MDHQPLRRTLQLEPGTARGREGGWQFPTWLVVTCFILLAGVFAVPVVLLTRPDPPPPPPVVTGFCTPEELPRPAEPDTGGSAIAISAIDPTGRFVVGSIARDDAQGGPVSVLWDNGVPTVLPVVRSDSLEANDEVQVPVAVNTNGWVLMGDSVVVTGDGPPVVVRLPGPSEGTSVHGYDMNQDGEVVGVAWGARLANAVMRWTPDGAGGFTAEAVSEAPRAVGATIGHDGTVFGFIEDPTTMHATPYVWDLTGRGQEVRLPGLETYSTFFVTSGGWAIASAGDTTVRWNMRNSDLSTVKSPGAGETVVVGLGGDVAYADGSGSGFLARDGRLYRLQDPSDGPVVATPGAVSEDGRVVAGSAEYSERGGEPHAMLWRCPS